MGKIMTEEVLMMMRLESNDRPLPTETVSVEDTVQEIISNLSKQALEKGVTIAFERAGALPLVRLNAAALKLALGNLVENALKYSPEKAAVTVGTRFLNATSIAITVADRGPGIPEADRERIYDKYYRGKNARENTKGMGLGLYISKTLIHLMGGAIRLESRGGTGSRFIVSIPTQSAAFPIH